MHTHALEPHECILKSYKYQHGSYFCVGCTCGWMKFDSAVSSEFNVFHIYPLATIAMRAWLENHFINVCNVVVHHEFISAG